MYKIKYYLYPDRNDDIVHIYFLKMGMEGIRGAESLKQKWRTWAVADLRESSKSLQGSAVDEGVGLVLHILLLEIEGEH